MLSALVQFYHFFFNDPAPTEIYTLSLHDALPISSNPSRANNSVSESIAGTPATAAAVARSEEHTSELQSHHDIVCRLLLEKKKKTKHRTTSSHLKSTPCGRRSPRPLPRFPTRPQL